MLCDIRQYKWTGIELIAKPINRDILLVHLRLNIIKQKTLRVDASVNILQITKTEALT